MPAPARQVTLAPAAMTLPALRPPRRVLPVLLLVAAGATAACIVRSPAIRPMDLQADSVDVRTPAKAHLRDGSTILYPHGVLLLRDTLRGHGERHAIDLRPAGPVAVVPLDSVIGMESYSSDVNAPATFALTTVAVGLGAVATAGAAVAIFGSCPTIYSDSAGTPVLEAETFSYSIARLFEMRDVDVLRARPDSHGIVRLEVRNEMAETHYLNHLELLEVRHAAKERALPDARNGMLVIGEEAAPARARDRAGRDVLPDVASRDGRVAETAPARFASADAGDARDWMDLAIPRAAGADSVVIAFRMRNSLLNTVLLYDLMLAAPGARSLDWTGATLETVGGATALGRWYVREMGLRVSVRDGDSWREVARVADTGPIAWRDVAVVVPAGNADTLHVRLSYVTDGWRIDRVSSSVRWRRAEPRTIPVARVMGADGVAHDDARARLGAADERYVQTLPGQRFVAEFDAGAGSATRTMMLGSQGYYVEWVRGDWIRAATASRPFAPSDSTIGQALARWREQRNELETTFFAARVPVR
jgi:hypothetical protein